MVSDLESLVAALGPHREPSLIDPAMQRALDEQGYVVVEVMPREDALALAQEIAAQMPDEVTPNQDEAHWYHGLLDPDEKRGLATARLVWRGVMEGVYGRFLTQARCQWASVAVKPAGSPPTPLHHHWASTLDPFAQRLVCWTMLSPGTDTSQRFQLVPKSHQLTRFIRAKGSTDYFHDFSQTLMERHAIDIQIDAGSAIIFEDSLLHAVSANAGLSDRIAAIATFVGADMPSAYFEMRDEGHFSVHVSEKCDPFPDFLTNGDRIFGSRDVVEFRNANRKLTLKEFETLVSLGGKASLSHNPLDQLCHSEHHTQESFASL